MWKDAYISLVRDNRMMSGFVGYKLKVSCKRDGCDIFVDHYDLDLDCFKQIHEIFEGKDPVTAIGSNYTYKYVLGLAYEDLIYKCLGSEDARNLFGRVGLETYQEFSKLYSKGELPDVKINEDLSDFEHWANADLGDKIPSHVKKKLVSDYLNGESFFKKLLSVFPSIFSYNLYKKELDKIDVKDKHFIIYPNVTSFIKSGLYNDKVSIPSLSNKLLTEEDLYMPESLHLRELEEIIYFDCQEKIIYEAAPQLMGTVVDYLTRCKVEGVFDTSISRIDRFMKAREIYRIELRMANQATSSGYKLDGEKKNIRKSVEQHISNLVNNQSIKSACFLALIHHDFRSGSSQGKYYSLIPNDHFEQNAMLMSDACYKFLKSQGKIYTNITFSQKAFPHNIQKGDGDYIAGNTLFDSKCSISKPKADWVAQLIIYKILGDHDKFSEIPWSEITEIAIINPRLGKIYRVNRKDLDVAVKFIESQLIY